MSDHLVCEHTASTYQSVITFQTRHNNLIITGQTHFDSTFITYVSYLIKLSLYPNFAISSLKANCGFCDEKFKTINSLALHFNCIHGSQTSSYIYDLFFFIKKHVRLGCSNFVHWCRFHLVIITF